VAVASISEVDEQSIHTDLPQSWRHLRQIDVLQSVQDAVHLTVFKNLLAPSLKILFWSKAERPCFTLGRKTTSI
jgi:hypothetical protein